MSRAPYAFVIEVCAAEAARCKVNEATVLGLPPCVSAAKVRPRRRRRNEASCGGAYGKVVPLMKLQFMAKGRATYSEENCVMFIRRPLPNKAIQRTYRKRASPARSAADGRRWAALANK